MKHLLYYNLNSQFVTAQVNAGGDGTNVVSVVDGVAWCKDSENTYYRYAKPESENLTSYTITLHYVDSEGHTLAPDSTVTTIAYKNKGTEQLLTPKEISGVSANEGAVSLLITGNTEYTFSYPLTLYELCPLTFKIISGGTIQWKFRGTNQEAYSGAKTIQYRINKGSWITITSDTGTSASLINVESGDTVEFIGNNSSYGVTSSSYNSFSSSTTTLRYEAYGNIMSLIDSTGFTNLNTIQAEYVFLGLFSDNSLIVSCENLILPATTLTQHCYTWMFSNCVNITTAPELPATTLAGSCYANMFMGCTSLTGAPVLPATTLAQSCYAAMFAGCTGLTSAPELPATTLAMYCYMNMFSNCEKLNYVKCLATDISAAYCTYRWMNGVQTNSGTFVKDQSMTSWTTGNNGVPNNWAVQDAS